MQPDPWWPLQPFSGCALCSLRSSPTGCLDSSGFSLRQGPFHSLCCSLVLKYPPSDVCFLLTVRFSVNALREVAMSHQCVGCHVSFACVALTVIWYSRICASPPLLLSIFTLCPWKLSCMLIFLTAVLLAPTTVTGRYRLSTCYIRGFE